MKVALVTGVSSGIGRATATQLSRAGFRTFGTVRADGPSASPDLELVHFDVRDASAAKAGIASVLERAGRIDVLVNNVGSSLLGAFEETSLEEARLHFETNFFGALQVTQEVLPAMRAQGSGRIVNLGSILGFLPAPFMSLYAAGKHAMEGWSESLDHEVRGFGIRVVVVEPGFTRTNFGRQNASAARSLPEYREQREHVLRAITEGVEHGADPEDVASLVVRIALARSPRLRYQAGRPARLLRMLRAAAPAGILDSGIRKSFGLAGV